MRSGIWRACQSRLVRLQLKVMSAAEIIEEIQALPEVDRASVVRFIASLSAKETESSPRYLSSEQARPITQKIFTENAELFQKLAQ